VDGSRSVAVVTDAQCQLELKGRLADELGDRESEEGDLAFGGVVGQGALGQLDRDLGERPGRAHRFVDR